MELKVYYVSYSLRFLFYTITADIREWSILFNYEILNLLPFVAFICQSLLHICYNKKEKDNLNRNSA